MTSNERDDVMSDETNDSLDGGAETPRMNGVAVVTGNVAPPWLASQGAPTPAETPKAKRTRRTKAQMLADAAARPDAPRVEKVDQSTVDTLPEYVPLRDLAFPPPAEEIRAQRVDRLPIVACAIAVVSLGVSLAALIH
jgi:predicted RNA-binding protein with PUA-like domain